MVFIVYFSDQVAAPDGVNVGMPALEYGNACPRERGGLPSRACFIYHLKVLELGGVVGIASWLR